jgi:biotin carboxylase
MNGIVFIGTQKSGSSYDAISAAREMGFYTVLLTGADAHYKNRIYFSNVDLMLLNNLHDLDKIKNEITNLKKENIDVRAIVSFVEDYCHTASLLAKEFNLVFFDPEAIQTMLDKLQTRRALAGSAYSPFYREINDADDIGKEDINAYLPLVLKAPLSTGSKWVIKINGYAEYEKEFMNIRKKCPHGKLLLEEYVDGQQFLVETVVVNGKVIIAAVIEQEVNYVYRFIITGYKFIHDYNSEYMQYLIATVNDIVKLIGITNGPCHLELKYTGKEWKLIEINPRISGCAMNLLIETATGINTVKETLKLYLGKKPDFTAKHKKEVFSQHIIVNKAGIMLKITGRGKAEQSAGVQHVFIKPKKGQLIMPPLSMGHRYAYVIATGKTAEAAMDNAKRAAGYIRFYIKEIDTEVMDSLTTRQKELLTDFYQQTAITL